MDEFWICLSIPIWQLFPRYPGWHEHPYEHLMELATQYPPFKQGLELHGLVSDLKH